MQRVDDQSFNMQTGWISPTTLAGAWQNYNLTLFHGFGYRVMPDGVVKLRGMVKSGTTGTAVYNLPLNLRPIRHLLTTSQCSGGICRIDIRSDGDIRIYASANAWVSLDNISFLPGQF